MYIVTHYFLQYHQKYIENIHCNKHRRNDIFMQLINSCDCRLVTATKNLLNVHIEVKQRTDIFV